MNPKLPIIFFISLISIGIGAFVAGRTTSNLSIGKISATPYDKCMYQCMEGNTETVKYCSPDLKDYIDNYDKYYAPYGVSSAFGEKYADPSNPNSPEVGYKVLCFMQVVGCRRNLCREYLND